MPGRNFNSQNYSFGLNGMMKDDNLKNLTGASYTTDYRQLDTRLGRWFSKDPIVKPWESLYASFANNPIYFTDPNGLDPITKFKNWWNKNFGKGHFRQSKGKKGGDKGSGRKGGFYKDPEGSTGKGFFLEEKRSLLDKAKGAINKVGGWIKNIWQKFDNWMKTAAPDWAYSDLKGNSKTELGKGSKGNYGGMEYYLKGKNDGGDGPGVISSQGSNVALEDGSYLPGSGGGARYKGYTGAEKVMVDARYLFGDSDSRIRVRNSDNIAAQTQTTAESAHGMLNANESLLYSSPGGLTPGAVYIVREADGRISVWTYGDTPNRGPGWSKQQSVYGGTENLSPQYRSLLKQ